MIVASATRKGPKEEDREYIVADYVNEMINLKSLGKVSDVAEKREVLISRKKTKIREFTTIRMSIS